MQGWRELMCTRAVDGFISDNREQHKMLKTGAESEQVRGVILYVTALAVRPPPR